MVIEVEVQILIASTLSCIRLCKMKCSGLMSSLHAEETLGSTGKGGCKLRSKPLKTVAL